MSLTALFKAAALAFGAAATYNAVDLEAIKAAPTLLGKLGLYVEPIKIAGASAAGALVGYSLVNVGYRKFWRGMKYPWRPLDVKPGLPVAFGSLLGADVVTGSNFMGEFYKAATEAPNQISSWANVGWEMIEPTANAAKPITKLLVQMW